MKDVHIKINGRNRAGWEAWRARKDEYRRERAAIVEHLARSPFMSPPPPFRMTPKELAEVCHVAYP